MNDTQADALQSIPWRCRRVPLGTIKLSKLKACVNCLEIRIYFYCIDNWLYCEISHSFRFCVSYYLLCASFRATSHVSRAHHGIVLCAVSIENIGCSLLTPCSLTTHTHTRAFPHALTHTRTNQSVRFEWILRVNKQLLLENDSHLIYFIANYLFVVVNYIVHHYSKALDSAINHTTIHPSWRTRWRVIGEPDRWAS